MECVTLNKGKNGPGAASAAPKYLCSQINLPLRLSVKCLKGIPVV